MRKKSAKGFFFFEGKTYFFLPFESDFSSKESGIAGPQLHTTNVAPRRDQHKLPVVTNWLMMIMILTDALASTCKAGGSSNQLARSPLEASLMVVSDRFVK